MQNVYFENKNKYIQSFLDKYARVQARTYTQEIIFFYRIRQNVFASLLKLQVLQTRELIEVA